MSSITTVLMKIKVSGMLCYIDWQIVTCVSRDFSAFYLRVREYKKNVYLYL
jgi:hypothetical protein